MTSHSYAGRELDLFAHATNWKRYFSRQIAPYVQGDVLEVGAGFGATSKMLCDLPHQSWTCLEPDPDLAHRIPETLSGQPITNISVVTGTLGDMDERKRFDTILYIDVLEHIEDDKKEIETAVHHLKPGGHVVVLSPAHQALFTPFDAAIGHFRRYNRKSLMRIFEGRSQPIRIFYLDAAGFFASLANRLFLKQTMPTIKQIQTWDDVLVSISKRLDRLLGYRFGKTIVGVVKSIENTSAF